MNVRRELLFFDLFTTSLSIDFFEGFVSFYLKIDKIDRSCKRNSIIRMFG